MEQHVKDFFVGWTTTDRIAMAALIVSLVTGAVQLKQYFRDRIRIEAKMHWGKDDTTDALYLTNLSGIQAQISYYCFIYRKYRFLWFFPVDEDIEVSDLVNANRYLSIPPREKIILSFDNQEPKGSFLPGTKATGFIHVKLYFAGNRKPLVKQLAHDK